MGKYKIHYSEKEEKLERYQGRVYSQNAKNRADVAVRTDELKAHGKIVKTSKEYKKKEGKFGWYDYQPSSFCRRCGRALSDPDSVRLGIGPECRKKSDFTPTVGEYDGTDIVEVPSEIADRIYEKVYNGYYNRKECSCKALLYRDSLWMYPHDGGWEIEGLEGKYWIFFDCPHCGKQSSLHRSGVRVTDKI